MSLTRREFVKQLCSPKTLRKIAVVVSDGLGASLTTQAAPQVQTPDQAGRALGNLRRTQSSTLAKILGSAADGGTSGGNPVGSTGPDQGQSPDENRTTDQDELNTERVHRT